MADPDTHDAKTVSTVGGPDRFDGLHPAIYAALAGCALWMVIAAWASFSGQGYASYVLAIVTDFPDRGRHVWRRNADAQEPRKPPFAARWRGEIETS